MSQVELNTVVPTPHDQETARATHRLLEALPKNTTVILSAEGQGTAELPSALLPLLLSALKDLERGRSVTLITHEVMLTTQQAADLLRVSRPHLIKLLEEERIPFRRTGSHRRVRVSDLLAWLKSREEEQDRLLRQLTEEAQEVGLEY